MLKALLVCLLCACGAPVVSTCEVEGLAVRAELELNCGTMGYDVRLARQMLDDRGILPAADFVHAFEGVPILVGDVGQLDGDKDGTYGLLDGIRLSRNASALLHEMLHHLEHGRNFMASGHVGWEEKGYLEADREFGIHSLSPQAHWE